jgi:hypothetical protein
MHACMRIIEIQIVYIILGFVVYKNIWQSLQNIWQRFRAVHIMFMTSVYARLNLPVLLPWEVFKSL